MALTDNQCKNAQSTDGKRVTKYFDGAGLFLQVHASGNKYWRFQYYRPNDKKKDILALGVYPDVSLKAARQKQSEAKLLLAKGIDPKQHLKIQAEANEKALSNTFEKIARQWHDNRKADTSKWKADHALKVIRRLENHVFPIIGHKQITDILPMEVLDIAKKVQANGQVDTAHRVLGIISSVFDYGLKMRLCLFNPAHGLSSELITLTKTHYPSIKDPKELGKLLLDIERWTGSPQVRALLVLAPYVFVRPNEVRTMKWCEIDFKAAVWTKQATDMKNGIEHIIPLSRQALAIIEILKPVTGHYDYVFWNKSTGKPLTEAASRKALYTLGYKGKHTPHGWRHAASTLLHSKGFNTQWIEAQLAHKDPNITRAAYNHADYMNDRIKMMQEWADYLDMLKEQQ